ncbi:MAG: hypothetical protein M1820_005048 [Bogoriella megaspora]|nr:MAG: hypothetical protein M1820_005048 [Bogoriella megaspora]
MASITILQDHCVNQAHDPIKAFEAIKPPSASEKSAVKTLSKFDKEIPHDAIERFQDLKDIYFNSLCDSVFKSTKKAENLSWELKWLGESESNAKLHIVIACHKKYKKRVRRFFEKKHVKCELERSDACIQPAILVCDGPWVLASLHMS